MLFNERSGTIKRILYDQNYGFITGDDGSDYYFRVKEVSGGSKIFERLTFGDKVLFYKALVQRDEADGKDTAYAAVRIRLDNS